MVTLNNRSSFSHIRFAYSEHAQNGMKITSSMAMINAKGHVIRNNIHHRIDQSIPIHIKFERIVKMIDNQNYVK